MGTGWDVEKCCLTWQKKGDCEADAHFLFPRSLSGFAGHFPGMPIVPAIIQLQAVRYLTDLLCGSTVSVERYSGVKFKTMVMPDEELFLTLSIKKIEDMWSGQFVMKKSDGSSTAQGTIQFVEA